MAIPQISNENWQCYNTIYFKTIRDHKFIWFQYRLLNRNLGTRSYLTKLKITEEPHCIFCSYHVEDIIHLFWECDLVRIFWNNLASWLRRISPIHLILDRKSILFGYIESNKLSFNKNFILIVAKYFIFKCSKEKKQPNNIEFQKFFQHVYNEQMYLARTNCEFEKFSRLWSMFSFCGV